MAFVILGVADCKFPIVKEGDAIYDQEAHQLVFTTDHEVNSVTIVADDGGVQQISDVDKIQWTG